MPNFNDGLTIENTLAGIESVRGDQFTQAVETAMDPANQQEAQQHQLVEDIGATGGVDGERVDGKTLAMAMDAGDVEVEGSLAPTPEATLLIEDADQLDAGVESIIGRMKTYFSDRKTKNQGADLARYQTNVVTIRQTVESRIKAIASELEKNTAEEPYQTTFKLGDARATRLAIMKDREDFCRTPEEVVELFRKTNAFVAAYMAGPGSQLDKNITKVLDTISLINGALHSTEDLIQFASDMVELSKSIVKPYEAWCKRPTRVRLTGGAEIEAKASEPIASGTVMVVGTSTTAVRIVGLWDAAYNRQAVRTASKFAFPIASREEIQLMMTESEHTLELLDQFLSVDNRLGRIRQRLGVVNTMLESIYESTESINVRAAVHNAIAGYYSLIDAIFNTHQGLLYIMTDAVALNTSYAMISASRYVNK